jgi:hypothetical protein
VRKVESLTDSLQNYPGEQLKNRCSEGNIYNIIRTIFVTIDLVKQTAASTHRFCPRDILQRHCMCRLLHIGRIRMDTQCVYRKCEYRQCAQHVGARHHFRVDGVCKGCSSPVMGRIDAAAQPALSGRSNLVSTKQCAAQLQLS